MRSRILALTVACGLFGLQVPAGATWSIVAMNSRTGEIGAFQATCIAGLDLQQRLAVVIPGVGAGCVQLAYDHYCIRRTAIWNGLQSGLSPQEIVDEIQNRWYQYGIVDHLGRSATSTGERAGDWAGGQAATVGDLTYAVQGNVLAGEYVVQAGVDALLNTPGRMAEKLMAAMLASASAGGDGRCSCNTSNPSGCGSPIPGFDLSNGKSAHVAFMIVARMGDPVGVCNDDDGCANGPFFLNLNLTPGQPGPPDPILELHGEYLNWRTTLPGRPDQLESEARLTRTKVRGDDPEVVWLYVSLADYYGARVTNPNAAVSVAHAAGSSGLSAIGTPQPLGPGRFKVRLDVPPGEGLDRFEVHAGDGGGAVLLYPLPTLSIGASLLAFPESFSASSGGSVRFDLRGPADPSRPEYLLLGSLSGTDPGIPLGSIVFPLNPDWFLTSTYLMRNSEILVHTEDRLGPSGRAHAYLNAPPGLFAPLLGRHIDFAYLLTERLDFASSPVSIRVDP